MSTTIFLATIFSTIFSIYLEDLAIDFLPEILQIPRADKLLDVQLGSHDIFKLKWSFWAEEADRLIVTPYFMNSLFEEGSKFELYMNLFEEGKDDITKS